MFKNYLKTAFRNLIKHKTFSVLNILGLSIGIAVCIFIMLYVTDELSYDRYHEHSDNIYRVTMYGKLGDSELRGSISSAPVGPTMKEEIDAVKKFVRLRQGGFPVFRYKDKVFSEENVYWADSTLFDVFSFEFIKGHPASALNKPNHIVLTESMANKYFGDEDPMGKTINSDNRHDYLVTGVIKDMPQNSHFHADFFASLVTYPQMLNNMWIQNNLHTYVLIEPDADPARIEERIEEIIVKYAAPQFEEFFGSTWQEMNEAGMAYDYDLQPLTDIHLKSHLDFELEPNSNINYVYIFFAIAIAILIIACINFMNLSTAKSANRAREVGIRKTVGSYKSQLITQFITETILTTVISVIISVSIVLLLLPWFNNLTGKAVELNLFGNLYVVPTLIIFAVVVGFIAGIYPAFFLSAFRPVTVLKGSFGRNKNSNWLRNGLVVFQFAVSIFLLIGTIVIWNQLDYIQNKQLGFNKEQVIVVEKTDDLFNNITPFINQIKTLPNVIDASNSNRIMGMDFSQNAYLNKNVPGAESYILASFNTDCNFSSVYDIKMKEGRYFSPKFPTDSNACVINESAAKMLGLEPPYTDDFIYAPSGNTASDARPMKIVGVFSDFHFASLHNRIGPMISFLFPPESRGRYVSVRVKPEEISSTIENIQNVWYKFSNGQAFEYMFFDEHFAQLYAEESRTGKLAGIFSGLAIFVACLGLFGLAAYSAERRTKEIGIRKAVGAGVPDILTLLVKEFTKLVLIANIVAWPAAYLIMDNWLQDFAFRIDMTVVPFIISAAAAFIVAVVTVIGQALKAATANPVNALNYE